MWKVLSSAENINFVQTVKTLQFVQQVQGIIDEDPSKSIKAISRDHQVSNCTIHRIFHEDIPHNSYVMRKLCSITKGHEDARLDIRESV